jgi:hypothetical protein
VRKLEVKKKLKKMKESADNLIGTCDKQGNPIIMSEDSELDEDSRLRQKLQRILVSTFKVLGEKMAASTSSNSDEQGTILAYSLSFLETDSL